MALAQAIRVAASLACFCPGSLLAVACGDSGGASDHPNASAGVAGSAHGGSAVAIPVVAKEEIGNRVFNEAEVQSYYLTFSDAEYAKLMDMSTLLLNQWTVNEDRYVEASLRIGDTDLPSIGVRFKGQFSLWGCVDKAAGKRRVRVEPFFGDIDVCQRFSLKLAFDEYDEG